MHGKGTPDCVNEHFKPFLDTAHVLEATPSVFELNNFTHSFEMNIELSMIYGKMNNIIQGDSHSFCYYCKVSRLESNDIFCIREGFQIKKSYAEVPGAWEQLHFGELQYSNSQKGRAVSQNHCPTKFELFCNCPPKA